MTRAFYGRNEAEVKAISEGRGLEEMRGEGLLVGEAGEVAEQLQSLREAGVERVMLQWMETDDLRRLETFAEEVLPLLA